MSELDAGEQQAAISARIRDLEAQLLQVSLRVEAPGLGEPEGGSEADKAAVAQLEKSLKTLSAKYASLGGKK